MSSFSFLGLRLDCGIVGEGRINMITIIHLYIYITYSRPRKKFHLSARICHWKRPSASNQTNKILVAYIQNHHDLLGRLASDRNKSLINLLLLFPRMPSAVISSRRQHERRWKFYKPCPLRRLRRRRQHNPGRRRFICEISTRRQRPQLVYAGDA